MAYPSDYSSGDKLTATDYNLLKNTVFKAMTAGETINGATLPVPVYYNTADDEVYKCDGDDNTKIKFIGFAVTNSTDGNSIEVQTNGIVPGFSGLTEGVKYYISSTAGSIVSAPDKYKVLIGRAISATEIEILFSEIHTKIVAMTATGGGFSNTVTETSMLSFTLPANSLSTNNILRIKILNHHYETTTTTSAVTFRLKYGSTTVASAVTINSQTANIKYGFIEAYIIGTGATNAQDGYIQMIGLSNNMSGASAAGDDLAVDASGTATEDSTGDLTVEITAQFSASGGSNALSWQGFIAELLYFDD